MTKKITYDFILLPLPFFLSIFFSFHFQSGRASGEGGWNGLRLHGREGRERRCVVIPLLPRPAPLPPPPLLLYQKGRLHLSYRHVFPCVSSSLAHIASQPPFVILFPRGDPSEMPGALGGWSDLPFVLCFVFFPSSSSSLFCGFSVFVLLQAGQATVRRAVFSFRTVIQIFGNQW